MSIMKTRKELMVVDENHGRCSAGHCAVCGCAGWLDKLEHTQCCPLRDPGVTHVRMTACRAKVVLRGPRMSDGKFWWTSSTGHTYDIERRGRGRGRGRYYVMHERKTGKSIWDAARLCDIRQYIVDNQGVL